MPKALELQLPEATGQVRLFHISVPQEAIDDLRARLRATRFPNQQPVKDWSQGVPLAHAKSLIEYWESRYDWRRFETELNSFPNFRTSIDGLGIHFIHVRSPHLDALPIVLTHGWPSTFAEMLGLVDRLGDRFDLVVPSLPGYAFSQRPPRTGVDRVFVARLWHQLMQGLGYQRYGAYGADFGAGVTTQMALTQPDRMIGIHVSTAEMWPYVGPGAQPLSAEEQAYVDHVNRWEETERGYSAVQSTRPQTLGYALNDSPAGLVAWVLDKWRSWSDSGGDLDARFGRDALLTMLTIWWASGSITSSMRDYYDNRWYGAPMGPADTVRVPTAMAVFANEFVPEGQPPRSWYERLYLIRRWTVFPRGGHFAAFEEPDLLAEDIADFFTDLQ